MLSEQEIPLDLKIQLIRQKNEAAWKRHQEVEADKRNAANQNALVQMNSPPDDEWIPGRHDSPPRDRENRGETERRRPRNENPLPARGRARFDHQNRDFFTNNPSQNQNYSAERPNITPNYNLVSAIRGRRFQNNERVNHFTESAGNTSEDPRRQDWRSTGRQWMTNRGQAQAASQMDYSKGLTVTSKVFKNSAIEDSRGRKPVYRLAEGDGPPPDPSYSFLGDSMRDNPPDPESEKNKAPPPSRRGNFTRGGRGGARANWTGRTPAGNSRSGDRNEPRVQNYSAQKSSDDRYHNSQSYEAWRKERNRIDQERINRQKTSDGHWSREWDSNKVLQDETAEDSRWNRNSNRDFNRSQRNMQGNGDDTSRNVRPRDNRNLHWDGNRDNKYKQQRQDYCSGERKPKNQFTSSINKRLERNPEEEEATSSANNAQVHTPTSPVITANELCVESNEPTPRTVETSGGTIRVSVSTLVDKALPGLEAKAPKVKQRKRRTRSSASSTTIGSSTHEGDDGSWEDISDEEITELRNSPIKAEFSAKAVDISSGPESLDPIPSGKEDGFLWDEFHPAGFESNMSAMEAEAAVAYKALLEKNGIEFSEVEDGKSLEIESKIDPLLVTTHIVQAEVDCMSLPSLTITDEVETDKETIDTQKKFKNSPKQTEDTEKELAASSHVQVPEMNVEQISGPISLMEVPISEQASSDSETSFKSVESPNTPHKEFPLKEELVELQEEKIRDPDVFVEKITESNLEVEPVLTPNSEPVELSTETIDKENILPKADSSKSLPDENQTCIATEEPKYIYASEENIPFLKQEVEVLKSSFPVNNEDGCKTPVDVDEKLKPDIPSKVGTDSSEEETVVSYPSAPADVAL